MHLATIAALAAVLSFPALAQPLDFVAIDGPWLSDAVRYARADGLVLARSGTVLGRSWDGGANWERFEDAPDIRSVRAYQGGLLAGSTQGLVRSYDNGATWSVIAFDGQLVDNLHVPDSLYIQTSDGTVYRSGGNPSRWTALDVPGGAYFPPLAAGLGGDLALKGSRDYQSTAFYRSTDYGETFTLSETSVTPRNLVYENRELYSARGDIEVQIGPFTTITDPGGVYRFDDDQGEFDRIRPASSVTALRRQPNGTLTYMSGGRLRELVSGTTLGLPGQLRRVVDAVVTDDATLIGLGGLLGAPPIPDGIQYVETSSGMMVSSGDALRHTGFRTAPSASVAQLSDGALVIGSASSPGFGGTGDAYRFGAAWQPLSVGAPPRQFVPLWGEPDSLIVVPDYGAGEFYNAYPIRLLVDGQVSDAVPAVGDGESLAAVAFSNDRAVSFWLGYLGYNQMLVLDRSGTILSKTYLGDRALSLVAQPDGLWAGSDRGEYEQSPEVSVRFSTDDGQTWQDRSAGLDGAAVLAMTAFGDDVFAGTPTGIASWDGAVWAMELDADDVTTFATHDGVLYAGADGAVFRRDDAAWTEIGTSLGGARVRGLAVGSDADGLWMVAATDKGVRTTRPSLLVGSEDAPPTAARRELRAFPNPVRGALTIEAPKASATIAVYDAVGRRVARLASDRTGVARWETRDVPPGVYLIRSHGEDVLTTRVVVVR